VNAPRVRGCQHTRPSREVAKRDALGCAQLLGRNSIRTINQISGIITTVAGNINTNGPFASNQGVAATAMRVNVRDVAAGPDGIYGGGVNAGGQSEAFHVAPPAPTQTGNAFTIADRGHSAIFSFDASGRHLNTRNALTGSTIFSFGYDPAGRLLTVADSSNLVTHIERDASGAPEAIVGPFGQRTTFTLDPNGYLASIADPVGNVTQMQYTSDGLLTQFTNARGEVSGVTYDANGLLHVDADAAGGSQTLDRTESGLDFTINRSTALGRNSGQDLGEPPVDNRGPWEEDFEDFEPIFPFPFFLDPCQLMPEYCAPTKPECI
jgi:YD repeat-containing protein